MKNKFVVYHDENEPIKTFKNEHDAVAFYNNPKNYRQYGSLVMKRESSDGSIATYNDRTESWE